MKVLNKLFTIIIIYLFILILIILICAINISQLDARYKFYYEYNKVANYLTIGA